MSLRIFVSSEQSNCSAFLQELIKSLFCDTLNKIRAISPLHTESHCYVLCLCIKSKKDNKLYIGYTNNLKRRLQEHNEGVNIATKHRKPLGLVYYESYKSSSDAKKRETSLKRFSQSYTGLKKRIKNSLA